MCVYKALQYTQYKHEPTNQATNAFENLLHTPEYELFFRAQSGSQQTHTASLLSILRQILTIP